MFGGIVLTAASVFVVDPLRGIWPSGNMLPRLARRICIERDVGLGRARVHARLHGSGETIRGC